eukprot:Seg4735.2 transcript_id=Seg4735.2/GoldUCD/mRNA.D3Y31 product="hypothetical protein" protein_id=Seg4735.2/GoldUCD/D3Y31
MLAALSSLHKSVPSKAEDIMVVESSFEEMGQPKHRNWPLCSLLCQKFRESLHCR